MEDKYKDINSILRSAMKPETLKDLFDNKLKQLEISHTSALDILGISYRTLKGILDGSQKTFDHTHLLKIASLLQVPREEVIRLYLNTLEEAHPTQTSITPEKIKFIKDNFDLGILKKDGFIDSITDFPQIEKKLLSRLGLKSIFEYRKPDIHVAFSSGSLKLRNELTRAFWIASAKTCFLEIDNPYEYDKQAFLDYFPRIRWQSTDVKHGMRNIIKALYRLGITVIYQPRLHTLQLRGATFSVNDKPCVVLTNYVGFYSTLWFALIHELLHVIFDWEDIRVNKYHLSDDSIEDLAVKEKEFETDKFARQYLFSIEKTNEVRPYLNDNNYVKRFATDNHVHPSLIYTFNAFDVGSRDRMAWPRARRQDADIKECIESIDIPWQESLQFEKIMSNLKSQLYN